MSFDKSLDRKLLRFDLTNCLFNGIFMQNVLIQALQLK